MAEAPIARSALAEVYRTGRFGAPRSEGPALTLRERRGLALVHLAGRPGRTGFLEAAADCLGVGLPLAPNTTTRGGDVIVFWLAPTRWLVQSATLAPDALERRVGAGMEGTGAAVNDVSSGRAVVGAAGPALRAVLAKGCPIDLHPRSFPPGACAQTALSGVAVLLHAVAADTFDLHLPRSFAYHVWEWLLRAAEDCGGEIAD